MSIISLSVVMENIASYRGNKSLPGNRITQAMRFKDARFNSVFVVLSLPAVCIINVPIVK